MSSCFSGLEPDPNSVSEHDEPESLLPPSLTLFKIRFLSPYKIIIFNKIIIFIIFENLL